MNGPRKLSDYHQHGAGFISDQGEILQVIFEHFDCSTHLWSVQGKYCRHLTRNDNIGRRPWTVGAPITRPFSCEFEPIRSVNEGTTIGVEMVDPGVKRRPLNIQTLKKQQIDNFAYRNMQMST